MTTINEVSDGELARWMGSVLSQHIDRIEHSRKSRSVFGRVRNFFAPHGGRRLKTPENISRVSEVAVPLMRQSVKDYQHHHRWVGDSSLQILVSTLRSTHWDVRPFFESGYTSFVEGQWEQNPHLTLGNADFAHVIFDTDLILIKVHLNYLPRDRSTQILPLDILSEDEKRKYGVFTDGDYSPNPLLKT